MTPPRDARPLALVAGMVTRAAEAGALPEDRMAAAIDLVCETVDAQLAVLVHGRGDRYDVRLVCSRGLPGIEATLSGGWRVSSIADPALGVMREGDLNVFTPRSQWGDEMWEQSSQRGVLTDLWGINEVAFLPVVTDHDFIFIALGRHGSDFTPQSLDLLRQVRPVVAGLTRILDPESMGAPGLSIVRLTRREREVLVLLADGHKASAIARQAGCSERTVHRHLSNIYGKLEVGDRLSAVRIAHSLGLLPPSPTLPH